MFEQLLWTPASLNALKNTYDPAILEIICMITKLIMTKKNIRNLRFKQKAYSLRVSLKYILRVHATLYPSCFEITIYGSLH